MGSLGRDRPRRSALRTVAAPRSLPEEGAYAFEELLRRNRAYSGYSPADRGTRWVTSLAERSSFVEMFKSAGPSRSRTGKLRAELAELPLEEWPQRLRRIPKNKWLILRRSIDPDHTLSEYGLDSLGNLELRTQIEAETGIRITSSDVTTVRGLADHLYANWREKKRTQLHLREVGPNV